MPKLTDMLNREGEFGNKELDPKDIEGEVFCELHEYLRGLAKKWIKRFRLPGQPPLLETDHLVAEAFLYKIRRRPKSGMWENREHFLRYCARKMHDLVIDELRDRARELDLGLGVGGGELEQVASKAVGPQDLVATADRFDRLRKAVNELPEGLGELVQLYYFSGQSQRKIAKEFGCKQSEVRKQLEQAKELLKAAVNPIEIGIKEEPDE